MELRNMQRTVGTIGHIGSGRTHRSAALMAMTAALVAASVSSPGTAAAAAAIDADMKRLFKTDLKVKKRNRVMRPEVRTFTALPKTDIKAIDILQLQNSLKGIKAATSSTLFDIFMIYKNEESIEEINEIGNWGNQYAAQFIHGAYAIVEADLRNLADHIKDNEKQKHNINTLESIIRQIQQNMGWGLIKVLSAPEPSGGQILSPEAVTAVKDFEGIYRRVNNITNKIAEFKKLKKS
jgi:hypothetical protein